MGGVARLIACSCDDAPRARSSYSHRLAPQARIVALLHRHPLPPNYWWPRTYALPLGFCPGESTLLRLLPHQREACGLSRAEGTKGGIDEIDWTAPR